jgi:hypothetical protein
MDGIVESFVNVPSMECLFGAPSVLFMDHGEMHTQLVHVIPIIRNKTYAANLLGTTWFKHAAGVRFDGDADQTHFWF